MNRVREVAVFLGPSLGLKEARQLLAAEYLPPARKGDIYRIMSSGVKTIILVDGVFHDTPSVWPREILSALDDGIQVIGGASMGALRAAELNQFGMAGYGTIFQWYRDAVIEGDDEVAVRHGSAECGFRTLSEALVNIRYTLDQAVADHVLCQEQAQELLGYAKQLYYPDRSYAKLLGSAVVNRWSEHDRALVRRYLLNSTVNLKCMDTVGLLRQTSKMKRTCVAVQNVTLPPREDLWQFDRLCFGGFAIKEGIVSGEIVLHEARKDTELMASMRRTLIERCFLLEWAAQNSVKIAANFLDKYRNWWEELHQIDRQGRWLRRNGLTYASYNQLLTERALVDWITAKGPAHFGLVWDFEGALQQERRLMGEAAHVASRVDAVENIELAFDGLDRMDPLFESWVDLSRRRFLVEWARQNGICCPTGPLEEYRKRWAETSPTMHCGASSGSGLASLICPDDSDWLREKALLDWITKQGPHHFGLLWTFEGALLRELQITGRASQLLECRRRA
jgi:hypothetical protein